MISTLPELDPDDLYSEYMYALYLSDLNEHDFNAVLSIVDAYIHLLPQQSFLGQFKEFWNDYFVKACSADRRYRASLNPL